MGALKEKKTDRRLNGGLFVCKGTLKVANL